LPFASYNELSTIQESHVKQKRSGKISAFEHSLKQVRAFEVGTRKIRIVARHSSQIGSPKIRAREIESAQLEPSQRSLG
jgi:hypothetical protein